MTTTVEQVKYIQDLVMQLKDKQLRIDQLEAEMKQLEAEKVDLEENVIPETMLELGANSITLMTKEVVTVKPFYYARLPQDTEPFFKWLRENGFGGLIKEKLEVIPPSELVELIVAFLNSENIPFESGSTVHWKTLEAWFKEMYEQGAPVPTDLFTNHVGRKAKVK